MPPATNRSAPVRGVLALVARGTSNREIAAELVISEATVRPSRGGYARCQSAGVFGGSQPGCAWWPWRQRYVEPP
ncbi:LuxR C-terminal-related transcriptional regulator [Streptomyces venezuelae]|uniref:LuxR C-terminal-related transcriptional regulator n=1 Tax=Streptomyces venezuelae TaxID=54571 RepID=UPI0034214D02